MYFFQKTVKEFMLGKPVEKLKLGYTIKLRPTKMRAGGNRGLQCGSCNYLMK